MSEKISYELLSERIGPLPIVNYFIEQIEIPELLEQHVPVTDKRCRLPYAKGIGLLIRSILVEREPIYRHYEVIGSFTSSLFGLTEEEGKKLCDDQLGRSLDHLFFCDRGTLLTEMVVSAAKRFNVRMDELHNDSTSIRFTGQYRSKTSRSLRGKRIPWITYGFSKDHRPDLKQLLFILTTSADGGVPVQFRCENGNTNDSATHIQTWETLRKAAGSPDFLYVGDSKLCSYETVKHIDRSGGRLVTVMPRSRKEDGLFRKWIQNNTPEWEKVWDRPNPRKKYGPRDRWYVYKWHVPSMEGWPVIWVYSKLLALHQKKRRLERITKAAEELLDLDKRLQRPRPRLKSRKDVGERVEEVLKRLNVTRYFKVEIWQESMHKYKQERKGRPGPNTRYRRETKRRLRVRHYMIQEMIDYDENSDGMYPLLTNDRTLTPRQVLEAHKRQPDVEKRFEQVKTVYEIAPVFLKNEGRIEAFFFVYFMVLLIQGLIERQIRNAMKEENIDALPIYPEDRSCRRPTAQQVLRLFSFTEKHVLKINGKVEKVFPPEFTPIQKQVLKLLGVPMSAFQI